MANELPYFRFVVQAAQNGKIAIESYEMQGLFYSICGFYWVNDCSITKATLNKKYKDCLTLIEELIKLKIIKHSELDDEIEISFLNEQFDILSEKRKAKQIAGSKGGKQKASNTKAKTKQKASYKIKEDKIDNIKEVLSLPFDSDKFKSTWKILLEQKKWKNKSEAALNLSVKKLAKFNEATAIKMIENTIEGGWAGLFEISAIQKTNSGSKSQQIVGPDGSVSIT